MLAESERQLLLRISTLGGLSIYLGDEPVVGFASRKAEALLVYLTVTRKEHPREAIADLLWDDRSQEQAMSNLRTVLASLRKCVGDYVYITRHTAGINTANNIWVDALELGETAEEIQDKGGIYWPSESHRLSEALGLYNGDFLQAFNLRGCREFESWMLVERERLYQLVLNCLEDLVKYSTRRGEYREGIVYARRWMQLNPIMETAHMDLMRLLYYAGRKTEAVTQFENCVQILEEELGVEPSNETVDLHEKILSGQLPIPDPEPVREPAIRDHAPLFLAEDAQDRDGTPVFVARRNQLEQLDGFLNSALQGDGQVCFVTGGPGRGKSALLAEFARKTMTANPEVLIATGRCNAFEGVGDSYLPFREILEVLSGNVESIWSAGAISTEHARCLWDKLPGTTNAIAEYGPHLVGSFISPADLLARAESALSGKNYRIRQLRQQFGQLGKTNPDLEQNLLFEQFTNVLGAISTGHPLLLVIDDLQWADNSSIALLFHLGRRLEGRKMMLAAAYRPEEIALGRDGERHPLEKILNEFKLVYGDVWIDLGDLDIVENHAFIHEYVDNEPNKLDKNFRESLFEQTGGQPLFTIELLRDMQERGDLVQDARGSWVESGTLDWRVFPARVEAVIQERFGRLEEKLKSLLSFASIEGENFTAQVLSRIGDLNEAELLNLLVNQLQKKHRLVEPHKSLTVGAHHLTVFRFSHILFQKYIYDELRPDIRQTLRFKTGLVMEEIYEGYESEIAAKLARLFRGDPERERKYARAAAERAAASFATAEALTFYNRALELTPSEELDEYYELLLGREKIFYLLGNRTAQRADLVLLNELADLLDDNHKMIEVSLRQARFNGKTGDYPGAIERAQEAIYLADAVHDIKRKSEGHLLRGTALMAQGDNKSAADELHRSLTFARASDNKQVEAKVLRLIGGVTEDLEDLRFLEQALEIYRQLGDLHGESKVLNNLGARACYETNEYDKAIPYFERSINLSRKIGSPDGELWPLHNLGTLYCFAGSYSQAKVLIEQVMEISNELNFKHGQAMGLLTCGDYHRYQGDYTEAKAIYTKVLTIAEEIGAKGFQVEAHNHLGLTYNYTGKHQAALRHARKAMKLAEELDDFFILSWTCTAFMHERLNEITNAVHAYNQSYQYACKFLNHPDFTQSLAGLARLSLADGDLSGAEEYTAEILEFMNRKLPEISNWTEDDLDAATPFDGTLEPFLIYLTCYRVMKANQDPSADEILDSAYRLLQARASKIEDKQLRNSYLIGVSHHKDIVHLWAELAAIK
jgi:DNA-binding SARP family transcriptional activator/Tfp pilus assembly protein PilF